MSYTPSEMPQITDVETLRRYVTDELRRIADGMDTSKGYQLVPLYAEPARFREGLVVYADGTEWDPGSGKGVYVRTDSAWVKL